METDQRLRHTNFVEYQRFILPYLAEKVGPEVENYNVYCLFREPTDWLHSWYRFRTRPDVSPDVAPGHWEYTGGMSWTDFLNETLKKNPKQFANLAPQSRFVQGLGGMSADLTLFRYDEMDRFLDHMKQKVGQDFDVVQWNVSPRLDDNPTQEDIARCRVELAADYRVYDAIPAGGGLVEQLGPTSGAGTTLLSRLKSMID